jgi:hypothetical protein
VFASDVTYFSSILMPWVTIRKVKVDVEVVRAYNSCSISYFYWPGSLRQELLSFASSEVCNMGSSPESHGRPSWSIMHSALYRMFTSLSTPPFKVMRFALIHFLREGTHAKYHYLICGVKGDFTRNLVLHPPTHLWTRQLKVRRHRLVPM